MLPQPRHARPSTRLLVTDDPEALARAAADLVLAAVRDDPALLIAAATGNTPTRTYALLPAAAARSPGLFARARILKLDEWAGLADDDPASCEAYLRLHVLGPLGIAADADDRYAGFRGDAPAPAAECARIAAWLAGHGPIGLALLGLGVNGHVGFNEPADALPLGPHLATLSADSLAHPMLAAARSRPTHGLTLGIGDLAAARQVLLLVSGPHKAAPLARLLAGPVTTRFPASLLLLHPRLTILCDRDAARLLDGGPS